MICNLLDSLAQQVQHDWHDIKALKGKSEFDADTLLTIGAVARDALVALIALSVAVFNLPALLALVVVHDACKVVANTQGASLEKNSSKVSRRANALVSFVVTGMMNTFQGVMNQPTRHEALAGTIVGWVFKL